MSKIAVIQLDTETLRAVYGIEELLVQPSVTLSAAYAVPRVRRTDTNGEGESSTAPATSASSSSISGWIVGAQLDTARASGDFADKWEVRWPFRSGEGAAGEEDWTGREFVLKHLVALFNTPTPPTSLILVPPPSQSNPISSLELYTQLAFESLGIAYLSILPASLAASYALNTTSGVVVHLGKHASHVSVVVDSIVRNEWSTVAPVGLAHCEAYTRGLLGEDKAVERELALAAGKSQDGEAGAGEDAVDGPGADGIKWEAGEKDKLLDELNEAFWRGVFSGDVEVDVLTASGQKVVIQGKEEDDEGAFDVAKRLVGDPPTAANPNKSKKSQAAQVAAQQKATAQAVQAAQAAQAAADADVVLVTLPSLGKEVKVGTVRNRLIEPLFRGVDGGESVVEAMGRAIARAGVEGLAIWDGVGVVGDLAGITTLAPALTTFLSPFLVSSSDIPTDVQPTKVRLLSIPDYFVNYKGESGDLAPFLGASMAAKALLSDPGLSVNKIQYNSMGPAAIHATREEAK